MEVIYVAKRCLQRLQMNSRPWHLEFQSHDGVKLFTMEKIKCLSVNLIFKTPFITKYGEWFAKRQVLCLGGRAGWFLFFFKCIQVWCLVFPQIQDVFSGGVLHLQTSLEIREDRSLERTWFPIMTLNPSLTSVVTPRWIHSFVFPWDIPAFCSSLGQGCSLYFQWNILSWKPHFPKLVTNINLKET